MTSDGMWRRKGLWMFFVSPPSVSDVCIYICVERDRVRWADRGT